MPHQVPSWIDPLRLEDLASVYCPREVPKSARSAWLDAVRRTASLFNNRHSGTSAETDLALKLLFALPKVCAAKWAGKASRSTSRRLLKEYPFLSPENASSVVQAFQRPKEPRSKLDAAESRRRAVLRQMRNYQVGKAAQILVTDGLAEMNEQGLQALQDLHPQPRDPSPPVPPGPVPVFRQNGGPTINPLSIVRLPYPALVHQAGHLA